MDYDQTAMPESYDQGRQHPQGVLEMWLDRIAGAVGGRKIETILDLGCGTGRFSGPLANRFHARTIGLDPSQKMLSIACAKAPSAKVHFLRGRGDPIPIADASIDMIFISMVFHHFPSPEKTAQECRRVLRDSGIVCLRNSTRDQSSPYEDYFPNYRAVVEQSPSSSDIIHAFRCFRLAAQEIVPHLMARDVSELCNKAAYRADSTLLRLSDHDFEKGLAVMREAAAIHKDPVLMNIDFFVFAA
jgi:ubiquinone/menaquinone biosynthesis C-methylase UbiE